MRAYVVDVPDSSRPIDHVVSNKKRLLPNPIAKLPLGSVKPKGWIRKQLDLMVDGMTGHLYEISQFLTDDNGWFGTEKEGWEEQPYWFRGFYDLGVLTGDKRIQDVSAKWIEKVLATQAADGYFGGRVNRVQKPKEDLECVDLWGHMVMLDALRTHWEATGDARIIKLAREFFRFCASIPEDKFVPPLGPDWKQWRPGIQTTRAGDMLPHIYWLYDLIGEDWLLDLATRFHNHVQPPESEWLNNHIVHFTQRFREPGNYYAQSKDPKHLAETEYWYDMHMAEWGQQPGGVFAADERLRPGKTDPKQGFETCGMTEFNKSFYILGQITGQALYADRVEDIIFNSFPASQPPDQKALHYLTAANQPQLDASKQHDYFNKGRQIDYSPHIYRCCQHNVAMGWPYYAEHLWLAGAGNGLVAWMYGACEVTAKVAGGEEVTVKEETDYPFDTSVKLTFAVAPGVDFPLYLRVPRWCKAFSAKVNGEVVNVDSTPGAYVVIERAWNTGDTVEIEMPVELSVRKWKKSGSVTVDRGPLSYSLKIGEDWRKQETGTDEWPDWEVFPTTPWNYGLVYDPNDLAASFRIVDHKKPADQPWTLEDAPITIGAKGKRIPNWTLIDETITDLQPGPIKSTEPIEDIELIPMGCARLRIACFPVIGDGSDAREWQKVSSHEEAMLLRLSSAPPEPL
jgi:hypothetical protein